MDRYIGIDAHSESCTVVVMGPSGKRIRQQVLETHAKVLIDFLKGVPGEKHVCMEEGQLAEWLVESLEPHVSEVVVIQPTERHGNKDDAGDAWGLAEQIRVNARTIRVFKPTRQFRPLREAVRAHAVAVKEATRAKNRLRSLFRSRGVSPLDDGLYASDEREKWLRKLPPAYRRRAKWLGQQVDATTAAHAIAESWLLEEAKNWPDVTLLKTAPGIGDVRAAQIVAIVVSPHRFRTTRQFWSYCGLGIVNRASSEWTRTSDKEPWRRVRTNTQTRGLNLNRQPLLKAVFKGAAISVLAHPNPLRATYDHLVTSGTRAHLARLTIARKIAAIVLAIWKKKEAYDPNHRTIQNAA